MCLNAQRRGWAACPAKSLPAQAIEESVLGRVRDAHAGIFVSSAWEKMDRARQVEAMQAIVDRVGYDATSQKVSLRFHPAAITTDEAGVRA